MKKWTVKSRGNKRLPPKGCILPGAQLHERNSYNQFYGIPATGKEKDMNINKIFTEAINDFMADYMDANDPEDIFDDLINGEVIGDVADDENTLDIAKKIEDYLGHTLNSRNDYMKLLGLSSAYAYANQYQGFKWGVLFMKKLLTGELAD